jgi:hypothetical protein
MEQPQSYHSEVVQSAIEGLVKGAPATIPIIMAYAEMHPQSPGGRDSVYALGEVAYRQGSHRDPRIVPGLLKLLRSEAPKGTRAVNHVAGALRQCARATPLYEATADLLRILQDSAQEEEPFSLTLMWALETLVTTEGPTVFPRLEALQATVPEDHPLAVAIKEILHPRPESS